MAGRAHERERPLRIARAEQRVGRAALLAERQQAAGAAPEHDRVGGARGRRGERQPREREHDCAASHGAEPYPRHKRQASDQYRAMDDDELLARSARDPEAFGAFYARHERLVLGYFMRRTRDPELSADLAAETFAAALLGAKRFRGGGVPASAWLVGIARNTLSQSLRRARVADKARRRLGMEPVMLDDALLERIDGMGTDVETLLARLTPEQSAAVRARVLEEQDYAVIASRVRCSESVVRQRVSRGLATLRRIYEEEEA